MTLGVRDTARRVRDTPLRVYDPRRIAEIAGERVVFEFLKRQGFLDALENKRILEIGPKHGQDSLRLAGLKPRELVLIDLPNTDSMIEKWLPTVPCRTTYVQGNVSYLTQDQVRQLGTFNLVWCTGVIYYECEQLRLLKRLFDLTTCGGRIVVESSTTRNSRLKDLNVVEIHWPMPYRHRVTHLPSRLAIRSWLEMVGFEHCEIRDVYSRRLRNTRAVCTAMKTTGSTPYSSHTFKTQGLNPRYEAGAAT